MKKSKLQPPTHRGLMVVEDREEMLSILIRNEDAFCSVKDTLTYEHFNDTQRGFALAWRIATDYYKEHGELPSEVEMFSLVRGALSEDPNFLEETEREELEAWLARAYDPAGWGGEDITTSFTDWAQKLVKRHMNEYLADQVREVKEQGRIVLDMGKFLDDYAQLQSRIEGIGNTVSQDNLPEGWDTEGGIHMFPTGITVFDELLGGGQAPGECYGLMGPYASCKTIYAVMLACQAARTAQAKSATEGGDYYSILVSYEARMRNELRLRMVSYLGQIHRDGLESMGTAGISSLSTNKDPSSLKSYETFVPTNKLRAAAGKNILGEQERYHRARKIVNDRVIVLDLTGDDESRRGQGSGYISEIASQINLALRKKGPNAKALQIVIDYVGAMAKRHLAAEQLDYSELRHLIGGAPLQARDKLATPFNCPVWLVQQLSARANAKGPGAWYDYTDAAECGSFAENLDFCLVIGRKTETRLCQLVNAKTRRTAGSSVYIIEIQGEMHRVAWTAGKYAIDPYTRAIKLQTELAAGNDTSGLQPKKKKKPVGNPNVASSFVSGETMI